MMDLPLFNAKTAEIEFRERQNGGRWPEVMVADSVGTLRKVTGVTFIRERNIVVLTQEER
jgi:hypothetical protein